MLLKQAIRELTPPILFRVLQKGRKRGLLFQGDYADWSKAKKVSRGYDQDEIVQRVFEAEMKVKRGEAADARDGVSFDAKKPNAYIDSFKIGLKAAETAK